jgi:hypothetical protein
MNAPTYPSSVNPKATWFTLVALFFACLPLFASEHITSVGALGVPRQDHTATLLADGRVLIVGGQTAAGELASVEVYDPVARTFAAVGSLSTPRVRHAATRLADGKVLITGGRNASGALNTAEIFDPAAAVPFRVVTATMGAARQHHTGTLLGTGKVLIAGGDLAGTAELFDPATETFSLSLIAMIEKRAGQTATMRPENIVLLAGGGTRSVEVFDLQTDAFLSWTVALTEARTRADAIPAADGSLYFVGGESVGTLEKFDLLSGSGAALPLGAVTSAATSLANGNVLVTGPGLASIFTPATGAVTAISNSALIKRSGQTLTELPSDKQILVVGGVDGANALVAPAALYNPARIVTDKQDYLPDEPVIVYGFGWKPGEEVDLYVVDNLGWMYDSSVIADAAGQFTANPYFVVLMRHLGVTFDLTAIGTQSGLRDTHTFTDGIVDVAIVVPTGFSTLSVAPGGTISVPYAFTYNTNNGTTSITYSVYLRSDAPPGVDYLIKEETVTGLTTGVAQAVGSAASPATVAVTFDGASGRPLGTGGETYSLKVSILRNNGTGALGGTDTKSNWVAVSATSSGSGSLTVAAQFGTATYGTGGSPTFAIDATRSANGTFNGTYSVSGLPSGVTGSFVPTGFNAGGSTAFTDSELTLTVSGTVPAGSYPFTVTCTPSNGGSTAFSNTGTLVVSKAPLTITASNDSKTYWQEKTYGAGSTAFTTGAGQLKNGDTVTSVTITDTNSGGAATAAAGGSYPLTPSAAVFGTGTASNYEIGYVAGALTVNKATLTITANNDSKTYGQEKTYGAGSTAFTTGVGQLKNGDTVTSVTITDTNSGGVATAAAGGSYPLTPSAAVFGTGTASNYEIGYVAGALTVNKATLTITAGNQTVAYGTPVATVTGAGIYTPSGFKNGEAASVITGSVTYTTTYTATTPAGTAGVTITPVVSGLSATNYSFLAANGAVTVEKAVLTITAGNQTVAYGTPVATVTGAGIYTPSGFKNGETASVITGSVTYTTTYTATTAAGTAGVTITPVVSGLSATNYSFLAANGAVTVNKAVLTITAASRTKIYGELVTFGTTVPSADFTVSGLKNSDTVDSITLTSAGAAASATVTSPGPTYPIVPSAAVGTGLGNYDISYQNGTLTVTSREGRVAYIGQTLFITSGSSSTSAQVTLTASVADPDGSSGGTIAASTVTFTDLLSGKVLASGVKVSLVDNTQPGLGTANTIVTLSTGQYGAQCYLIEVTLGGSYKNTQQTTADSTSDAYKAAHPIVTVAVPGTKNTLQAVGSASKLGTAAGSYGLGTLVNFTAGINYTNKGTNTQGKISLIIEQADGTYYINSNSITSVAFSNPVGGVNKDVTVYAKASIYKVGAGGVITTIDGGVTLRMDARDGGATGDTIGFTVLSSKTGLLYYSNNWVYDSATLSWRTGPQGVSAPSFVTIN